MSKSPDKLVKELINKTLDLGGLIGVLAVFYNNYPELVKLGEKIKMEQGQEIVDLAREIVSRMVVDDE